MKLKQLLGILLLTTVCTTMAAAAAPSVAKPAKTISIKNVAVVRGKSGMQVEILAAPGVAAAAPVDPAARAADAASKFYAQPQGEVMPASSAALNSAQPVNFLIPQQAAPAITTSNAKRYTGEPISVNLKDVD